MTRENPKIDSRTAGWMLIAVGVALSIYIISMLSTLRNEKSIDLVTLVIGVSGLAIIALYASAMLAVLPVLFEKDNGEGRHRELAGIPMDLGMVLYLIGEFAILYGATYCPSNR